MGYPCPFLLRRARSKMKARFHLVRAKTKHRFNTSAFRPRQYERSEFHIFLRGSAPEEYVTEVCLYLRRPNLHIMWRFCIWVANTNGETNWSLWGYPCVLATSCVAFLLERKE